MEYMVGGLVCLATVRLIISNGGSVLHSHFLEIVIESLAASFTGLGCYFLGM